MRVISVDLGLARTGIATGDDLLKLVSPVTVINEYNEEKLVDKICICASFKLLLIKGEILAELLISSQHRR